jgi:hypothetical protein
MALATSKDLCMDAVDPVVLGRFWAGALGLDLHDAGPGSSGDVKLLGPTPGHTVWVNRVPEPRTVKHRLHIDVNVSSVDELTALGATVVDDTQRWTVMADPEGGELCAFVREGPVERRLYEVVVDCDPRPGEALRLAAWWSDVLGATLEDDESGIGVADVAGAPFEYLVFAPVPEPKTVKNRIHLDVTTSDLDLLVGAGATVLRPAGEDRAWTVLADPAGNELCAFVG